MAEHCLPIQTKGKYTPLPTKGKMNILTILVDFKDIKFKDPTKVRQQFENIMNMPNYAEPNTIKSSGSVRDFYLEASYGQLDITSTVVGPYTIDENQSYFGKHFLWIKDAATYKLVKKAVKRAAEDINMSQFDNNGDGYVECIHVVFAGHGESENKDLYRNSIWPHQGAIHPLRRDKVTISRYMITPELNGNDRYSSIGVICHELGHILGAPDFYDTNYEWSGQYRGTGQWDLMASGDKLQGGKPAHPNPYVKAQLFKWTEAKELTGNHKSYTLKPSEQNTGNIYKISTPDGGYYLLENRQYFYLPGHGLVIYHVHPDIANKSAGDLLGINNEVNVDRIQKCYVVDASSSSEYPTGSPDSYGSISGGAVFPGYSSSPNIFFTSTSTPSNVGWDGQYPQNKDVAFIHEDGDNIKFVFNPSISGPSTLCTQGIYSIPDVPDMPWETSIDWSYGSIVMPDPQPVIFGEGQGTESSLCQRQASVSCRPG